MKKILADLSASSGDDQLNLLKSINRKINEVNKLDQSLRKTDVLKLLDQLISLLTSTDDEVLTEDIDILLTTIAKSSTFSISLSVEQETNILEHLVEILAKCKNLNVLKRCLNLIKVQEFSKSVIELFVESILTAIDVPKSLEMETVEVITKLISQCPSEMKDHILLWLKSLLLLSAHQDSETRQIAVAAMKSNMDTIVNQRREIIIPSVTLLKKSVLPGLKLIATTDEVLQEILTSNIPAYTLLVGENFKKSSSLSNLLLPFVEKGFRNSKDETKRAAFKSWGCFIDCFATNKEIIASTKYIKLLTQPLRLKLKSQDLVKDRLKTLWKVVVYLGDKMPDLFEVVCKPLLLQCISSNSSPLRKRRSTGRLSQDLLLRDSQPDKELQRLGIEMLSHLLLDTKNTTEDFSLPPLISPFLASPSTFMRFQEFLLPAVSEVICSRNEDFPDKTFVDFWNVLLNVAHDCISRKKDNEIVRMVFQTANHVISASQSPPEFLLMVVSSLTKFPQKVLNSSLLYSSDNGIGMGMIHRTPNLNLMEMLLSTQIVEHCIDKPELLDCVKSVISCGMERQMGVLEFVQAVTSQLKLDHMFYLTIWNYLAEQTIHYIETTGNINQGDSLEHDFSSIYLVLLYQFQFLLNRNDHNDCLAQCDSSIELWNGLWENFVKLSIDVETVTLEEARKHIASKSIKLLSENNVTLNVTKCKLLENLLNSIVNGAKLEQAPVTNKRRSSIASLSNVDSEDLYTLTVNIIFKVAMMPPSLELCVNFLPAVRCIFENIPQSMVLKLFADLASIFQTILLKESEMIKLFQEDVEDCWRQVTLRLPYSSDLFLEESITDVFSCALQDSTPSVYHATVEFWEMKVLESFDAAAVSEEFLFILTQVYEQNGFEIKWKDANAEPDNSTFNVSVSSCQSSILDGSIMEVEESIVLESPVKKQQENLNRSVNLRKLANPTDDENSKSTKVKSSDTSVRRSARLSSKFNREETSKDVIELSDEDSPDVTSNAADMSTDDVTGQKAIVLDDSDASQNEHFVSACDVTNSGESEDGNDVTGDVDDITDDDDDVVREVEKSVYEVVEVAEISVNQTRPLDETSNESDDTEIDTSLYDVTDDKESRDGDDSVFADRDESVYENVEMLDVSSQDESQSDEDEEKEEEDEDEEVEDEDEEEDADEKSIYEVVEVNDITCNQTLPQADSSSEQSDPGDDEIVTEKSIYEVVEVAEMSLNTTQHLPGGDPDPINDTTAEESCSEGEQLDQSADGNDDELTEKSIYEVVEVAEMSLNTTQHLPGDEKQEEEADEDDGCDKELGVEPLDVSFEGETEAKEECAIEDGKQLKVTIASIEPEVLRPLGNIPIQKTPDLDSPSESIDSSQPQAKPGTPLRRSLRKRVSTPKVVAKDNQSRQMRSRQRLATKENAEPPGEVPSPPKIICEESDENPAESDKTPDVVGVVVVENLPVDVTPTTTDDVIQSDVERRTAVVEETPATLMTIAEENEEVLLPTTTESTVKFDSPKSSEKPSDEYVVTPKSCPTNRLATLREQVAMSPMSPSGILKRRLSELPSPANKSRRVSFAEPISSSSKIRPEEEETIPSSPNSNQRSDWRIKKINSRIVSRRLSLPAPKRPMISSRGNDDVTRSPMSIRSARVAAAIADIKARGSDLANQNQLSPTSTNHHPAVSNRPTDPVSPSKSIARVNQLPVSQLANTDLLQNLSIAQLTHLTDCVVQAVPVLHQVFMQKMNKR